MPSKTRKKQRGGVRGNPGGNPGKTTKTRNRLWNIRNHYVNLKRKIQSRQADASTDPILRMTPRRPGEIHRNIQAIINASKRKI
jgi:hypothetical protein